MAATHDDHHAKLLKLAVPVCFGVGIILLLVWASAVYGLLGINGQPLPPPPPPHQPALNRNDYDRRMRLLAHLAATATRETVASATASKEIRLWPARAPYPGYGALLPFNRIVAYYGNFRSTGMGVLGEYPPDQMLGMLKGEADKWQAADPSTHVIEGIDYIAVTAQGSPGDDGTYRARMPDSEIDKAVALADKVDGVVILEVQAGKADLQKEITRLEKYLAMPRVHLAIDPEFRMKYGQPPGRVVGTVDASDVNAAAEYLASLVRAHDLPPKILIVHRYTRAMVTNATKIKPLSEVQIIMDMDGWGPPPQKYSTYNSFIVPEPVQFTGFKLFYKNDIKQPGTHVLTPEEVLKLTPQPVFIQYQ